MAIEQLGESLLSQQRARIDEREKENEKARKRQERDQLLQFGGQILGNIALSNSQKKANEFMRNEAIMASRAKYNAGVAQSIALLKRNEEALAHSQGIEGYLRDSYIPLLSDQLKRTINEKEYTKDGFDTYVYNEATKLANKNKSLFTEAVDAAMRVGNDSTAFDKFIKVNDGIADSALGAMGQSIAGLFRGKSKEALREASIISNIEDSDFIKDVAALQAARQALLDGKPVIEAEEIARNMQGFKQELEDYEIVSSKNHVQTNYFGDKRNTQSGQLVTRQDGWGRTYERFEPDEPMDTTATMPDVKTEQFTSGGIIYNRTTTIMRDRHGNPASNPIVKDVPIQADTKGAASVTAAEAQASGESFRQRLATFQTGLGNDRDNLTGDPYAQYVLRGEVDPKENLSKEMYNSSYANMIANAATIAGVTQHDKFKGNSKDLPLAISQHIVLNDLERMSVDSWGKNEMNYALSVKGAEPTTIEILEAIGSIKMSDAANVSSDYIKNIVNSEAFFRDLNSLSADKSRKRVTAFMQAFSAYEDEEAYSHLFEPLITDNEGRTYSVFQVLSSI